MNVLRIYILLFCSALIFSCDKEKDDKTKSDIDIETEKSSGGISAGGKKFKIKYENRDKYIK